jgi:hypothetical protein
MKLKKGQIIYRRCHTKNKGTGLVHGQEVGRGAKQRAERVVKTNGGGWIDKCKVVNEDQQVVKLASLTISGPHIAE